MVNKEDLKKQILKMKHINLCSHYVDLFEGGKVDSKEIVKRISADPFNWKNGSELKEEQKVLTNLLLQYSKA